MHIGKRISIDQYDVDAYVITTLRCYNIVYRFSVVIPSSECCVYYYDLVFADMNNFIPI